MRKTHWLVATLLVLFTAVIAHAAKKNSVSPSVFQGKDPKQVVAALLELARAQAENGTWERIAVGRVHYLSGDKTEGQRIFDQVLLGGKAEDSDRVRIARVYVEAGEWPKAQPIFDAVLRNAKGDEDWHAEVGAYYLLNGDRETAERLFARSFELDPANLYNTLRVASAYAGLAPKE